MIIVVSVFYLTVSYALRLFPWKLLEKQEYKTFKASLGKVLLLGLEILVAADIVRTVALETTIESVTVLGLLVLIRIFLSWSLIVEIEGRWPWQPPSEQELEDPLELLVVCGD